MARHVGSLPVCPVFWLSVNTLQAAPSRQHQCPPPRIHPKRTSATSSSILAWRSSTISNALLSEFLALITYRVLDELVPNIQTGKIHVLRSPEPAPALATPSLQPYFHAAPQAAQSECYVVSPSTLKPSSEAIKWTSCQGNSLLQSASLTFSTSRLCFRDSSLHSASSNAWPSKAS